MRQHSARPIIPTHNWQMGSQAYYSISKREPMLVTTLGEDRRGEAHQDEGYQLRWQKPRKDKHEGNNLHHTRAHQDATIEDTHSRQKLSRSHQRNNIRRQGGRERKDIN